MVTITKLDNSWSKVELSTPIDGSKELIINHNINIVSIKLVDIPSKADMVEINMVDGEMLELHFSVGVVIDGVAATDNQHLMSLIANLFTS